MVFSSCSRLGVNGVRVGLIAAIAAVLAACSISQVLRPDWYTVQRGDTLYSIGQRFNVDWHKLARWNQIRRPYIIHVGEKLTLKPYPELDYTRMNSGGRRRIVRAPQDSSVQQQRSINASVRHLEQGGGRSGAQTSSDQSGGGGVSQIIVTRTEQPADNEQTAEPESISTNAGHEDTVKPGHHPARATGPSDIEWQWPASGALVQGYSAGSPRTGVEIEGELDAPIYAAASGTVVYNGPGLKGFGGLIILKHGHHYLSAYGYVRNSLVEKGEKVGIGQRIASMGYGPGQSPMLHFEIRRGGEPVNPERLLPTR